MTGAERDAELICAAQKDSSAFRVLYDLYVDQIYRFVYYRVSQHQETAEDLTAEVFAKALHALPKFRYQGYPYSTYLYQVARSVCADYYKKHRELVSVEDVEISDNEERSKDMSSALDSRFVWDVVETLPVTLQEMLRLRYVEDLSHEEIGRILGKSPGAVRTAISRSIRQLQDRYEQH